MKNDFSSIFAFLGEARARLRIVARDAKARRPGDSGGREVAA